LRGASVLWSSEQSNFIEPFLSTGKKAIFRAPKTAGLLSFSWGDIFGFMDAIKNPVTLTAGQAAELRRKLTEMRHNVNNCLSLVAAAIELAQRKPELTPRLLLSLSEQPQKIAEEVRKFACELETALSPPPKL
jgi:hypothetical protein